MRTTTHYTKGTFEMHWDCPACDRVGNLGVTHQFCPGCGHTQDANRRYIPTPQQRRAVKPPSSGRQVSCLYCEVLNDPSHAHCQACGASLTGAQPVPLRPSLPEHQGETGADARCDHEARQAAQRAARVAHHQPEAARAREAARAELVVPRRLDRPHRDPTPLAISADPHELDEDLRQYGIGVGAGMSARAWLIGAGAALFVLLLLVLFWKKDVQVEVQGHTWQRSISIERYTAVHDDDWCTSMPLDAYSVSRRSELHHTNRVPDGQTCRTEAGSCSESCRNVDNGNGSFSVDCTRTCTPDREVCETKYRDEPVYEDRCSYTVDRWRHARYATASGSRIAPAPTWPEPEYKSCTFTRLGCERLGAKEQTYLVHFVSKEDEPRPYECAYNQTKWASYEPGSRWTARVGILWSRMDCDDLQPYSSAAK